jgi:ketosteroid isomerase-like protein
MYEPISVDQLIDQAEIRRVLATYCHGLDRADRAMIASVYHDDAIDIHGTYDHGAFQGSGKDFGSWYLERRAEAYATCHFLGDSLFKFDGDIAHVQTYVRANHMLEGDPEWTVEEFWGRYLDRFERRNGQWLIAHRVVARDFKGSVKMSPMMRAWPYPGHRGSADPAYDHFAMKVLPIRSSS